MVDEEATAELTVGDQTFSFSVDECFASPGDGVRVRGVTEDGEQLEIDYSADAPQDRTLQVVDEGRIVYDGSAAEGVDDPTITVEEDSFSGSATFRSTDDSEVDGEMSGTC